MIITSCPDLLAWAAGDTAVVKPVTYRLTANSLSKMVRKAELEKTEENGLCKLKLPKGFNKTLGKTKLHVYLQPDEDSLVFVFENKADKRQGAALIVDNRKSDIFAIPTKAEIYEELGYEYASDSNADEDEIDSEGLLGDDFQDLEAEIVDDAATGSDNNADEKYDYLEGYATHTILNNKKHTAGVAFTVSLDELGMDSLGELLPDEDDEITATDSNAETVVPGETKPEKPTTTVPAEVPTTPSNTTVTTPSNATVVTVATPSNVAKTFVADVNGVTIRAHAEAGVLPEAATFQAIELKETGKTADAFKEACKTLDDDEDTEYDGVMAYDLHFLLDGEEVQPNGEVEITMEVSQKALPTDVDPSTLEVKHLAEDGDTLQVQTVADTADKVEGTVEVKEDVVATLETEASSLTKAEQNATAVKAEFKVDSFSYFAITYKKNNYVKAFVIDNSTGKEITLNNTSGELTFSSKYWPTDFGAGWENPKYDNGGSEKRENEWISMAAVAGTFGEITAGYTYITTKANSSAGDTITWIYYNSSNSSWYYDSNVTRPSYTPSGSTKKITYKNENRKNVGQIYMFYSQNPSDVSNIRDEIKTKGCLTVPYPSGIGVTFKWYGKDHEDDEWVEVERKKIAGTDYNIVNDTSGSHLYPALDLSTNIDDDETIRRWYKAEVWIQGKTEPIEFTEKQVPYYASLQNGSFEVPDTDLVNKNGNFTFPNGTTGLVWQTTGKDHEIEIVKAKYGDAHRCKYTVDYGSLKGQYAELNAEDKGALYQGVLTAPGSTLNWQFSHKGRYGNDSMYLVIAPMKDVENCKKQEQLEALIKEIQDGKKGEGYFCQKFNSKNDDWATYSGNYIVPSEQYLTQFFFVASSTSTTSLTEGNLLDAISFSTKLPAPLPGFGNLQVWKVAEGIAPEDRDKYYVDVTVKDKDTYEKTQRISFNAGSNRQYTLFENLPEGSYTVTETPGFTDMKISNRYTLQSQTITIGDGSATNYEESGGNVTVEANKTVVATFINHYNPIYVPLTISKTVIGNMGNQNDDFEFQIVVEKDGVRQDLKGSYDGKNVTSGQDNVASFNLKHGQSIKIVNKIPYGAKVTINEINSDQNGYSVSYVVNGGQSQSGSECILEKILDDTGIDYTNKRDIVIPTGLFDHGKPTGWWLLMVMAAGCLGFGAYRRKKKQDDREERL